MSESRMAVEAAASGDTPRRLGVRMGLWLAFMAGVGGFGVGLGLAGPVVQPGLSLLGGCMVASVLARLWLALVRNQKAP